MMIANVGLRIINEQAKTAESQMADENVKP